jgi:hypothetical protein
VDRQRPVLGLLTGRCDISVNRPLPYAEQHAQDGLSDSMSLSAGYRAIGDDYDSGSEVHRLLYNVTTFGPVIRIAFMF